MKSVSLLAAALVVSGVAASTPAFAQSDESWTGGYVGVQGGYRFQPNDKNEKIEFDTNLDGKFGDTVSTAAAPTTNIFSPGFCGGKAKGRAPKDGCSDDKNKIDWGVHAGYDVQMGSLVLGAVAEFNMSNIRDSVSAFSTGPDSYVMTRKLGKNAGLRLRAGFATGDTLFFVTGGGAWAKIKNRFETTNTGVAGAPTYTTNGNDDAWGYKLGGGVEQRLGGGLSVGLQYIYTSLKDDGYRVNAAGGAAGNAFIRNGAKGTDFRRTGERFNSSAVSATVNYRF